MFLRNITLSLVTIAALAACGDKKPENDILNCSSEETKSAFNHSLKADILKNFETFQKDDKQLSNLSLEMLSQDLDAISFDLEDIKAQSSSNENEVSCVAQLTVSIDNTMLTEAVNKAAKLQYGFDINRDAQLNGFEIFINDVFKTPVQYQINQNNTDQITQNKGSFSAALLKNLLIVRNVDKNPYEGMQQPGFEVPEVASAAETASEAMGDPIQNLLDKLDTENTASASVDTNTTEPAATATDPAITANKQKNQQARNQIDKMWNNLPAEVKDSLKEEEQAWKSNRVKSCADAGSEAKQLECETNSINKRIRELKQYSVE